MPSQSNATRGHRAGSARKSIIILWHLLMYLVNGVFLVILVVALYQRLKNDSPASAQLAAVFGLIWAGMVFQ